MPDPTARHELRYWDGTQWVSVDPTWDEVYVDATHIKFSEGSQDYGWIKTHVDVIDTISFGIFLARVHKGTQIEFEQTRLNNEIWLPSRIYLNGNARIALLKNYTFQQEDTFSKYRKFTTSTKILPGVAEAEPPKN